MVMVVHIHTAYSCFKPTDKFISTIFEQTSSRKKPNFTFVRTQNYHLKNLYLLPQHRQCQPTLKIGRIRNKKC